MCWRAALVEWYAQPAYWKHTAEHVGPQESLPEESAQNARSVWLNCSRWLPCAIVLWAKRAMAQRGPLAFTRFLPRKAPTEKSKTKKRANVKIVLTNSPFLWFIYSFVCLKSCSPVSTLLERLVEQLFNNFGTLCVEHSECHALCVPAEGRCTKIYGLWISERTTKPF